MPNLFLGTMGVKWVNPNKMQAFSCLCQSYSIYSSTAVVITSII